MISRLPISILAVARFPVGGIRGYLRYTYSRLNPATYAATVLAVTDREAHLLPADMAPLQVDLEVVAKDSAFRRLLFACHRLIGSGAFQLVHSQGTTAAVTAAVSARWFRVPHVVTLHETFRAEQFAGGLGRIRRWLIGRLLSLADAIVVVGEDARENLLRHVPLSARAVERITVIPNGIGVDTLLREAPLSRPQFRQQWNVSDDVILLGFIGRFMPEKGFDVVFDAVRRLKKDGASRRRFIVAAVNDGAFLREYKQQIAADGLEDDFIFAGFQRSAAGALEEFDAVLIPSRREACPLVAMEAMVLGCPIIASDCIGLREVTENTPAVRTRAGDPSSLADGIARFLADPQYFRDAARAHTATAREVFDSKHSAARLERVFGRVCPASDAPSPSASGARATPVSRRESIVTDALRPHDE